MNSALNFAKKVFELNIKNIETFRIKHTGQNKIVVFAPARYSDKIASAMSKGGAGLIGKYSECSFRTPGIGTFKGGKKSNPVIGKKGRLEKTDEIRLEMVCPYEKLNRVIEALLRVHPYEEPAYDIYEILSGVKMKNPYAARLTLKRPELMENILKKINNKMDTSVFPISYRNIKVSNVLVDFSNDAAFAERTKHRTQKTLYVSKIFKGPINIRLLQPGSK